MVEQCEPITYDNDKGRTSTPVKESSDQRKSPVKESLKFVEKSSEKLITTMNSSNEPSNKLPMINSSVNISQTNISVPVDCITSSSNLQLQFSTYSVSENKLYEVTKDSNVHLLPGINHSSSVYNKLPYENKLVNQLVCQSNFLPIQSIWPTTSTSLTNYDRSILETSADLSVNWGEHGEQIALSLDCRVKEKDIHNHNCNDQTTSHFIHSEPLTTSTQSFIDMTKLPVHSNTIDYSTLKSKCLDQDQPRLVIL
ncbi:unnamed protein product [Heterobilharzia americana]|nr:unnamed protein product [Heterobilharzia americana]